MKVERVVLDTNVLISAALSPLGKPFACLRWVLDNATLIVSRELLEELDACRIHRNGFAERRSARLSAEVNTARHIDPGIDKAACPADRATLLDRARSAERRSAR